MLLRKHYFTKGFRSHGSREGEDWGRKDPLTWSLSCQVTQEISQTTAPATSPPYDTCSPRGGDKGDLHPQEVLAALVVVGEGEGEDLARKPAKSNASLQFQSHYRDCLHFLQEEMQMCHCHTLQTTKPKDHRACGGCCVEMLMTGAFKFWLRKKGLRKLVLFYRGSRGSLIRNTLFSLIGSLSQAHWSPRALISGGGGHRGTALTGKWLARNFQSCCPNCLTRVLSCSSCQRQKERAQLTHMQKAAIHDRGSPRDSLIHACSHVGSADAVPGRQTQQQAATQLPDLWE